MRTRANEFAFENYKRIYRMTKMTELALQSSNRHDVDGVCDSKLRNIFRIIETPLNVLIVWALTNWLNSVVHYKLCDVEPIKKEKFEDRILFS